MKPSTHVGSTIFTEGSPSQHHEVSGLQKYYLRGSTTRRGLLVYDRAGLDYTVGTQ
jgi:hypothetical protein